MIIEFLKNWGETVITTLLILILLFLPWERISKGTNYNTQKMFKEGYDKAENQIKKGKDPTELFNQCPGADDAWDRGWIQACVDYRTKNCKPIEI